MSKGENVIKGSAPIPSSRKPGEKYEVLLFVDVISTSSSQHSDPS